MQNLIYSDVNKGLYLTVIFVIKIAFVTFVRQCNLSLIVSIAFVHIGTIERLKYHCFKMILTQYFKISLYSEKLRQTNFANSPIFV